MNRRSIALLAAVIFAGCATTHLSTSPREFRITLFSSGGFTGATEGITVRDDGWARFWRRSTPLSTNVTDSVRVDDAIMSEVRTLAANDTVYQASLQQQGNMTTTLALTCDSRSNRITFSGTQVPKELPTAVRRLIELVKSIHH